jgi:hypothetical protein
MKRKFKYAVITFCVLFVPLVIAAGQDRKTEQKIKVVVDDGSGTKVLIDTVFTGKKHPDSIKLKNGSVIYMKDNEPVELKNAQENEHITVTYTSESSDEEGMAPKEGKKEIKYNVKTITTSDGDKNERIFINKEKSDKEKNEKSITVAVSDDDEATETEKTRLVIARDGMVVTIEGNDEAKAEELAKIVEDHLGINKNETGKKQISKTEKKTLVK